MSAMILFFVSLFWFTGTAQAQPCPMPTSTSGQVTHCGDVLTFTHTNAAPSCDPTGMPEHWTLTGTFGGQPLSQTFFSQQDYSDWFTNNPCGNPPIVTGCVTQAMINHAGPGGLASSMFVIGFAGVSQPCLSWFGGNATQLACQHAFTSALFDPNANAGTQTSCDACTTATMYTAGDLPLYDAVTDTCFTW